MEIIDILKKAKSRRALAFGIGGGGDIVSTIPVANFLGHFGFEVYHGSVIWDRIVVDPKPGPRSLEELRNVEIINETVGIASENTRTVDGVTPNIARAAKVFGRVVSIDITKGVEKMVQGLSDFAEKFDVSLIIGVDAGGDAISVGFESGVRSPLADAMCVAALKRVGGIVAVTGFGSDGELRVEELLLNISSILTKGGFLGCTSMSRIDYARMRKITEEVTTEASLIPVLAYEGEFGLKKLRKGRTALITPLSTLIFYFTADAVFELNEAAKIVENAGDIFEANRLLHSEGILTEYDFERAVSGEF
ncbi:DUF1152 domain-containing protein [Archaeoglobus neptunius]|uniref:DUF1152 domain-containing protein n=1 Tax=Archaeoglobus neptunius TaxID=2798580 RepID=UPI0019277A8F|nr:DUF1152 domain-containing protein [Archaeoglobus neptunius]